MIVDCDTDIPSDDDPVVFDDICDPSKPRIVDFNLIKEAAERIKGGIIRTRCERSRLSKEFKMELYLKKEFEHPTGSFKERGACNTLRAFSQVQRQKGAIAASTGNHASAMAIHGTKLGMPVTVVMPTNAPLPKVKNCLDFGADIIMKGATINEARRLALKLADLRGQTYINGYDHPHILAGQGTIGIEILEDVPDVDTIIVPVGGGGLIAGIAKAVKTLKPDVKIYGVESVLCPSWSNAMSAGKPSYTPCDHTLADGLLVPVVGCNALETAKGLIDKMVTVDESYVCRAILRMLELEKAVIEGAGGVTLAAILANKFPELTGKKVVCVIGGGNIDAIILGRVIDRALALEQRLITIRVINTDKVGGMAELAKFIADQGVCIRDIEHSRCWVKNDVFQVRMKITAETRGAEHAKEFYKAMALRNPTLKWKHI